MPEKHTDTKPLLQQRAAEAAALRDACAQAALSGLTSRENVVESPDVVAERAYAYADAMLVARVPKPEPEDTPDEAAQG